MALQSRWVMAAMLVRLGRYCRISPFVFSFVPRSHEWWSPRDAFNELRVVLDLVVHPRVLVREADQHACRTPCLVIKISSSLASLR